MSETRICLEFHGWKKSVFIDDSLFSSGYVRFEVFPPLNYLSRSDASATCQERPKQICFISTGRRDNATGDFLFVAED